MNRDQNAHQKSIKMIEKNWLNKFACKQTQAINKNTSQFTIYHHLKKNKIGKVKKLGILVLHTLSAKNKEDHIYIATSLLSRQRNDPFLKNIITGDKEWVFYDNVQCKRQWIDNDESLQPIPKVEFHGKVT